MEIVYLNGIIKRNEFLLKLGGIKLKLNKETDYAIRMTLFCAKYHSKILSGIEIIQECKIPENLGKNILTKLTNSGILHSIKGKNGGFCYTHLPKTVSLFSIIKIFQSLEINLCTEKRESCIYRHGECDVCDKLKIIKDGVIEQFKNIYIEELIEEQYRKYNN